MKNFIRRPQQVQAVQFDGTQVSAHAILKWMGYESADDRYQNDPLFGPTLKFDDTGKYYNCRTGDWVVWENFKFKAISERVFTRDYEPDIITAQVTPAPPQGSYDANQSLSPPPSGPSST